MLKSSAKFLQNQPNPEPKFRSLSSCNTPLSLLSIALLPELGVPSVDLLVCVVLALITVSFSARAFLSLRIIHMRLIITLVFFARFFKVAQISKDIILLVSSFHKFVLL